MDENNLNEVSETSVNNEAEVSEVKQEEAKEVQYNNLNEPVVDEPQEVKMKHSGLGISSFIISIISGITMVLLIIAAGVAQVSTPGGLDETSPVAVILGLMILFGAFVNLVGAGLGIASVVQKNRKKVFGVLGLVFNSLTILGVLILVVVGNSMR